MSARGLRVAIVAGATLLAAASVPIALAANEPNDPGASQQWGLKKMRAFDAWSTTRGGGVTVAVIDTGVDAGHPDLSGRVLQGRDFVDDDDDASDAKGHGTHVAGTIAATAGNGVGVASVAPGAKILPVRVLGADGEGDPGDVADGIDWAVDRGARVINLSLAQDDQLPIAGDTLLKDTRVDEAIKNAARAGAVVVVAAGNSDSGGKPKTAYDATVAGVLVVGATTRSDERAAYSNYGDGLDVVAPGGGSASDAKVCSDPNWIVSTWWNPQTKKSDYGGGCGTSMAVAHVSGVAALLLSRGYSAAGAAKRIVDTAVDLGPGGYDAQTGYGRVDALAAVGSPSRPAPSPSPPRGTPSATSAGGVSGAGTPSPSPSSSASLSVTPTHSAAPPSASGPIPSSPAASRHPGPVAFAWMLVIVIGIANLRVRARVRRGLL